MANDTFPPPLPNVAVLCKSSDLVSSYAIPTTLTCDEPAVPPTPKMLLEFVFGVWFRVCIVHFEHLSQILYRLPFSRTENVALALTNFTVNIFIRQNNFWIAFYGLQ